MSLELFSIISNYYNIVSKHRKRQIWLLCELECPLCHEHQARSAAPSQQKHLSPVPVLLFPRQATFTGLGTTWLAGWRAANRKYGMGK